MSSTPLADYLGHIRKAASDARSFVEGMSKDDFLEDQRTHPKVPWRSMRGMRDRIAHGYFDISLDVVWDTVQTALPVLLRDLPGPSDAAIRDNGDQNGGTHD
jgi:uncharacterized protein with HEPN domain